MKLNAPKKTTWLIALIAGLIGLIGGFVPGLQNFAPWLVAAAWALLLIANVVSGL
jgi:hypothetical protein